MSDSATESRAHKILRAIEPLIYARRKLTMGLLLLITAFFAYEASKIQPDAGFDKSIPLKHPYMQVYKQYQEEFGGANTILVALMQKDGDIYNSKFLHRLKQVTDAVFFLPHIDRSQVQSLFTPNVTYIEVVEGGFYGTNVIPADYPAEGEATPEMLAKVKDHVGKANIIGRLVSNNQHGAMVQADLLELDPITGEKLDYGQVAHLIEDKVRGRFASPDKYIYKAKHDIVVGKDYPLKPNSPFKDGDVLFKQGEEVTEGYVHLGVQKLDHRFLPALRHLDDGSAVDVVIKARLLDVEQVKNDDYTPDIEIHIVGFAKVVGDVIDATQEVVGFFLLTLVMTMILLWLYVGNFKLAILPLVCSITAVIWEFGLLRLLGKGLDPFAILVPFLILAVSVSHGVQYVNAWVGEIADNGRNSFDASLFTWRRLAIYGTMAIMTDVAGFAMIGFIPVGIIREMALNACLGMAAIIITNKVMMPIWLTWVNVGDPKAFKAKQEQRDSIFDGFWRLLSNMTNPKPAITALLICAVLLGWGLWKGKDLQIGDSQKGVPELLPNSRYNQDNAAVVANFALGTDLIKVIAETDADACIKAGVMDQIYGLSWRLDNTQGVQSTLSLPELSRLVYSIFVEGSPKFYVLARNKDALGQAIKPITPPTGMLNESCSAMPIWTFAADHRATTIKRVVNQVEDLQPEQRQGFLRDAQGRRRQVLRDQERGAARQRPAEAEAAASDGSAAQERLERRSGQRRPQHRRTAEDPQRRPGQAQGHGQGMPGQLRPGQRQRRRDGGDQRAGGATGEAHPVRLPRHHRLRLPVLLRVAEPGQHHAAAGPGVDAGLRGDGGAGHRHEDRYPAGGGPGGGYRRGLRHLRLRHHGRRLRRRLLAQGGLLQDPEDDRQGGGVHRHHPGLRRCHLAVLRPAVPARHGQAAGVHVHRQHVRRDPDPAGHRFIPAQAAQAGAGGEAGDGVAALGLR